MKLFDAIVLEKLSAIVSMNNAIGWMCMFAYVCMFWKGFGPNQKTHIEPNL
jgi:hypothetical protein